MAHTMHAEPSDSADPPAVPRRGFLKFAAVALSLPVIAMLAWPLVASIVGSSYRTQRRRWRKVATVEKLPQGRPVRVSFPYLSEEAFIQEQQTRDIWVIKHSESDITVFSPICTHLSCRYDWNPQSGRFVCPCHGSVFAQTGEVLAGPAPRPLDTLPSRIEEGELLVDWVIFEAGVARKVPL